MTNQPPIKDRCRLILVVDCVNTGSKELAMALEGGDVASTIIYGAGIGKGDYLDVCSNLVKVAQSKGVATLIAHESQIMGRSGADGLYLETGLDETADMVARFSPQKIVGCGNIKQKHVALEFGELQPDFVFFGKLDGDIKPEPHPKNLALGDWWSELIEIPCVVMGGNSIESVVSIAESGAEFVALREAVFADENPAAAVEKVNALLDEFAPVFEESAG